MLIPLGTDRPLHRRPVVNAALIFINLAAFAATSYLQSADREGLVRLLSTLALDPEQPRWYTLFTYAFLHADFLHILGNLIVLWVFGASIEDRFGHVGYLVFFLAGAGAAGAVHAALNPAPVIGASGGVAAVTGAALVLLPRMRVRCLLLFFMIAAIELPAWWFVLFGVVKDVLMTSTGRTEGVATWAHLGGYAFGAVVAAGLLAARILPREPYDLLSILRHRERRRQIRQAVTVHEQVVRSRVEEPVSEASRQVADARAEVVRLLNAGEFNAAAAAYAPLASAVGVDAGARALSRRYQIDLANWLHTEGRHAAAADAYELFATVYSTDPQTPRALLLAALVSARYLNAPARAASLLGRAEGRLDDAELRAIADDLRRSLPLRENQASPGGA